jgi:hypothetical protein
MKRDSRQNETTDPHTKLSFKRETLRRLTNDDLRSVVGGETPVSSKQCVSPRCG